MAQIITTEVAAEMLGVTPQRVRQIARELGLEPQQIGKALIFSSADIKKMQTRKTSRGPAKPEQK
ncbi:MAG TPA: hypothetical protein VGC91_07895 [Pyrinomonadaceae bacterium]